MRIHCKSETDRDAEALFNSKAHETVRKIIDIAEDRLLEGQIEDPIEVEEFLCRFYIKEVADIVQGASWFMQGEATAGARSFLMKCLGGFSSRPHPLYRRLKGLHLWDCGNQLSFHTHYYFHRFSAILTQCYIEELHKPDNQVLTGAGHNGLFHLAAASLPGVREQINRELRRRGLPYDAAHVPVRHLERRMRALDVQALMIGKGLA